MKRSIEPFLHEFLAEKVVLLSGPRQVGKTFLSHHLGLEFQYFNFDDLDSRRGILSKSWSRDGSLVVLDEIHKMRHWKQWLKGVYDTQKGQNPLLVTGSARMDTYKKVGDSLAGRHLAVRLLPFSVKEVGGGQPRKVVEDLLALGGFPEPFLSGSARKAALWRRSHLDIILRQDLLSLESLREVTSLETLVELLSHRAGRSISYKNLSDELGVSPQTVKRWIQLLESYYIVFVVHPYVRNVAESVKKEPRVFFYDVGRVRGDDGFKLENLVALHLLKRNYFLEDTQGARTRLCYLRDKKKREVDFVIECNGELTHLIEVKTSDKEPSPSLRYFSQRLRPQHSLQLVLELEREVRHEHLTVTDLSEFLASLET